MTNINLRIPARADYVHVLRTMAAGAAAREHLSVDDIEDLRLAVGEACAYLLAVPSDPDATLRMQIVRAGGRLDVITSVDAQHRKKPSANPQQTVMWNILAALADEARLEEGDSGPAIHLTKLLPTR